MDTYIGPWDWASDGYSWSTVLYIGGGRLLALSPVLSRRSTDACALPGAGQSPPNRFGAALPWIAAAALVRVPMAMTLGRHCWLLAFLIPAGVFF